MKGLLLKLILITIMALLVTSCSHYTLVKGCKEYVENKTFNQDVPKKKYLCKTLSSWEYE